MEDGSCFPDLLPSKGFPTDHSSLLDNGLQTKAPQQHLTKNRPRVRKTRAPTRVTLLSESSSSSGGKVFEVNNNSSQFSEAANSAAARLDEGLDSFFPSIRVSLANGAASSSASANSLDIKEIISLPTIKESPNVQQSAQTSAPPPLSARPQPQPRKQPNLLRKFGFAKSTDQAPTEQSFSVVKVSNTSTELPPSSNTNSSNTNSHITLKNEDFMRAPSPTFFANPTSKRSEHVSICSESEGGRGGSPVPVGDNSHNEFLAEMRAKQKEAKRSHGSTPLNESLTFAGTLAEQQNLKQRSSPEQSVESKTSAEPNNNNNSITSNGSGNIAKRATIFGELHKSPSKGSITQACSGFASGGSSSGEEGSSATPSNFTSSSTSSMPKQRPKSMVGILGAKFELSLMNSSGNK